MLKLLNDNKDISASVRKPVYIEIKVIMERVEKLQKKKKTSVHIRNFKENTNMFS